MQCVMQVMCVYGKCTLIRVCGGGMNDIRREDWRAVTVSNVCCRALRSLCKEMARPVEKDIGTGAHGKKRGKEKKDKLEMEGRFGFEKDEGRRYIFITYCGCAAG